LEKQREQERRRRLRQLQQQRQEVDDETSENSWWESSEREKGNDAVRVSAEESVWQLAEVQRLCLIRNTYIEVDT
jgi:hypothetical protein